MLHSLGLQDQDVRRCIVRQLVRNVTQGEPRGSTHADATDADQIETLCLGYAQQLLSSRAALDGPHLSLDVELGCVIGGPLENVFCLLRASDAPLQFRRGLTLGPRRVPRRDRVHLGPLA
jgi:hypothetical protein